MRSGAPTPTGGRSSRTMGAIEPGGLVAVAIDAAGAASARPFSYLVPERLGAVEPGEAVLVEFGRRQAVGIVLGPAAADPAISPKPLRDRIRADGPLLPALGLALAGWIAEHYLAPPPLVLRAMLPPGLLERVALVAESRLGDGEGTGGGADLGDPADPAEAALLEALADGPRPVRDLAAAEGRAAVLRRLRALERDGRVHLDWILATTGAAPRTARFVRLAERDRVDGARLGPRQRALLDELRGATPADWRPASDLAARHGSSTVASLLRRGLLVAERRDMPRRPLGSRPPGLRGGRPPGADLGPEQAVAVERVRERIAGRDPRPILLDGVTGAGRTAVYLEAIASSLEAGRAALVLVPEIPLALPLVDRLRADLDVRVALLHSGLSDGQRADEWRRIRAGDVDVVVGTRLAVTAPIGDLGLVVVDEEHDPAYKSDRTPRLQARDTAIRLAELAGAACVLGSATPAVETEGRARDGAIDRVRLPTRLSGRPPTIEVVDLRAELASGNRAMLSGRLSDALSGLDRSAGEQAILVLNRRGSASVVLCRDCGHVQACPDCTRPLVLHLAGNTLRCHHCGRATPLANRCPACGSSRIRYLGGGTERLERELRTALPGLRTLRLDRDVVARRGAAEKVVDDFAAGRADVLVGTSLVTKGLDIPSVTLVGIVSADVALSLPDERASERTYQLLRQAVGRAGRGERPGRAIIQTYLPEHPAIRAVADDDPAGFYDVELGLRRRFGSPPFGRLVKLTVALPAEAEAISAADAFAAELRRRAAAFPGTQVIGPAPAYIARRADRWRYNLVLRGRDPIGLLGEPPGPPWSVDVDPESLL